MSGKQQQESTISAHCDKKADPLFSDTGRSPFFARCRDLLVCDARRFCSVTTVETVLVVGCTQLRLSSHLFGLEGRRRAALRSFGGRVLRLALRSWVLRLALRGRRRRVLRLALRSWVPDDRLPNDYGLARHRVLRVLLHRLHLLLWHLHDDRPWSPAAALRFIQVEHYQTSDDEAGASDAQQHDQNRLALRSRPALAIPAALMWAVAGANVMLVPAIPTVLLCQRGSKEGKGGSGRHAFELLSTRPATGWL